MTFESSSNLVAGKTLESTIGPAEVPNTNGNVWSFGLLSVNTIVLSLVAFTDFMLLRSEAGPFGSLILMTRWKLNSTSFAVSGSPFENFRPGFMVQVYVAPLSVKAHLLAASGVGTFCPAGITSRNWYS